MSSMVDPATEGGLRIQRSTRALSRRSGVDVLVTTPGDGDVHELSGGAAAVWADLETPRTVQGLVDRLAARHGADPADITGEVHTCLVTLQGLGIVEVVRGLDG